MFSKPITSAAILVLLCFPLKCLSWETNYYEYHKGIIRAENKIFIDNLPAEGLKEFQRIFSSYDFVFIDDCMEAFQLALFYKRDDLALAFIKKAIDNGFKIDFLKYLNLGCPCNFYVDSKKPVTIYQQFLKKHKLQLEKYQVSVSATIINRVDVFAFSRIYTRHILEQKYKNDPTDGRGSSATAQGNNNYTNISNNNLSIIDSFFKNGIYLGERNLSLINDSLVHQINAINLRAGNTTLDKMLRLANASNRLQIPFIAEDNYFYNQPLYIILFHNKRSYEVLSKYADDAIRKGFLHPREFASLLYNTKTVRKDSAMYLTPTTKAIADKDRVNKLREKYSLTSLELDSSKHAFAHQHGVMLFFGMFNGTK